MSNPKGSDNRNNSFRKKRNNRRSKPVPISHRLSVDDELLDITKTSDIYGTSFNSNKTMFEAYDSDDLESIDSKDPQDLKPRDDPDVDDELETIDPDNPYHDDESNDSELSSTFENTIGSYDTHKFRLGTNGMRIRHEDGDGIIYVSKRNCAHPDGYLKLVVGCMFSGKTTYVIRECKKWQSIGKNVLMINYAMDKRYSDQDKVVSHDKISIDCMMVDRFGPKLNRIVEQYDVILINEGQFFSDLRENVKYWCDKLKKIVVVSGLDGDYMRGRFGEILDLMPDCDDVVKLKAYCSMCKDGTDAIFTWKMKDNPPDPRKVVVDIGTDKYVPLCRKHYNQEVSMAKRDKRRR